VGRHARERPLPRPSAARGVTRARDRPRRSAAATLHRRRRHARATLVAELRLVGVGRTAGWAEHASNLVHPRVGFEELSSIGVPRTLW
jgi:hypothetical protein